MDKSLLVITQYLLLIIINLYSGKNPVYNGYKPVQLLLIIYFHIVGLY